MIMKNWTELENSSFFDANARERALGMLTKAPLLNFWIRWIAIAVRIFLFWELRWNLTTAPSAA